MCYICVGILFLCVIASSISNNDSTSIANTSNTQTQEAQQQVNKINVTTTDNNTYWYFTGQTSPTYKDNYYYALYVNNSTYYLSDMKAAMLCDYSPYVNYVTVADAKSDDPDAEIKNIFGGTIGSIKSTDNNAPESLKYGFKFKNDVNFTFEYETGQKVGINENQNVISKIYINGTEI